MKAAIWHLTWVSFVFVTCPLFVKAENQDIIIRSPIETISIPLEKDGYISREKQETVAVAWHPSGKTLACISRDYKGMMIESWNTVQGKSSKRFTVKGETQTFGLDARYQENGKALVVGGYQLDMESGQATNLLNYDKKDRTLLGSYVSNAMIWVDANYIGGKTWIGASSSKSAENKFTQWEINLPNDPNRNFRDLKILSLTPAAEKALLLDIDTKEIFWYNLQTKNAESSLILEKHKYPPTCWVTNTDRTILATGDSEGFICTWNLNSMKPIKVLRAHLKTVEDLAFSTDGKKLFGVDEDSLSVWDVETGKKEALVSGGGVVVAPSPDGTAVAVVPKRGNGRVELVDWTSSRKKGWVGLKYDDGGSTREEEKIVGIKWQSDANSIFAVSNYMRYYAIQINSNDIIERRMPGFFQSDSPVINDFSTDICKVERYGKNAATFNLASGKVDWLWGFENSRLKGDGFKNGMVEYGNGPPTWIGNGDTFVCGIYASDKTRPPYKRFLGLCNVKTGQLSLNPLEGILGPPPVERWRPLIAVSKDTKTVAFVCEKVAEIVDITEKKLLHKFNITEGQNYRDVYDPLISPDGQFLFVRVRAQQIAGGLVESFKAWDLRSGQSVELPELTKASVKMAISPDGSRLAVRTENQIALWALKNGAVNEERVLKIGYSGDYAPLAFSPDGNLLAAFESGGLRFWSVLNDEK